MSPTGNVTNWQFSQLPVGDINLYKSMSPTGRDFMSPTGNHPLYKCHFPLNFVKNDNRYQISSLL